jgi:hypothetical protein
MMKKEHLVYIIWAATWTIICLVAVGAYGETITGTVVNYGSTAYSGLRTSDFTLRLNTQTPDERAQLFLNTLKNSGQDSLLNAIKNENLGSFSLNEGLGRTINVVREVNTGGERKIYVVFERWEQFAEVRGGYRSLDYPFGYIEIDLDSSGRGTGSYFAAAQIRWKTDKKTGASHVEIDDYATLPAKLTNVRVEGR